MKITFGIDFSQLVYVLTIFLGVIDEGFAVQGIGLEEMAKGLIKRLAAFKNVTQRKMSAYGIANGQLRVMDEFFDNGYQRLLRPYHRDVVVQRAASRPGTEELL